MRRANAAEHQGERDRAQVDEVGLGELSGARRFGLAHGVVPLLRVRDPGRGPVASAGAVDRDCGRPSTKSSGSCP